MSFFDVENFTRANLNALPEWVKAGNELTKRLYDAVEKEFERICQLIESGENLSDRERCVVVSKIARTLNIDKSNIRRSRRPELLLLIKKRNEQLHSLYLAVSKNKSGKRKSHSEVIQELNTLRKKVKELENQNMTQFLEEAIKKDLMANQRTLHEEIEQVKLENKELRTRVANLENANQVLIRQLTDAID